jgi:large subunit ribosomal protein L15
VDEAALVNAGLVKGQKDGIKLLGHGEVRVALNVKLNQVSESARQKIEAAGGSVEVV